jgi:hypothetical protein
VVIYFSIVIIFLSFFVLNLFLAVISDSFEQVNQNELMQEREESKKQKSVVEKMSLFTAPVKDKSLEKQVDGHLEQAKQHEIKKDNYVKEEKAAPIRLDSEMDQDEDHSNVALLNSRKVKIDSDYRPDSLPKLKIRNVHEELKDMREEQPGQAVIEDSPIKEEKSKLKIKIPQTDEVPGKIELIKPAKEEDNTKAGKEKKKKFNKRCVAAHPVFTTLSFFAILGNTYILAKERYDMTES